jgi:hypothetical protein
MSWVKLDDHFANVVRLIESHVETRAARVAEDPELLTLPGWEMGRVYFIQAVSRYGLVKIGFTRKTLAQRLREIQGASPIRLAVRASIAGDLDLERRLHRYFDDARAYGEWFEPVPPLELLMERYA